MSVLGNRRLTRAMDQAETYEEWKAAIIHQMHLLEALLESGYVSNGGCRIETSIPPGNSP